MKISNYRLSDSETRIIALREQEKKTFAQIACELGVSKSKARRLYLSAVATRTFIANASPVKLFSMKMAHDLLLKEMERFSRGMAVLSALPSDEGIRLRIKMG